VSRDDVMIALGFAAGLAFGWWLFDRSARVAELHARAQLAQLELEALDRGLQLAAVMKPALA
jgi:hypothetical protein